ncbi:hypothetical protein GUITHDRAFT_107834 [Guillardia theta CCMP2712]|uniref:Uncharacterized protein n=1 Tax=Guillardia theta (strain CCMP2712) TaxID=905079 RepID=L1JCF9_GUITC|nr:hypothetical protein GUITHDRAFT_107834 [Guillardia theta CCMP2712]EKX46216.1 hypothetical protein GUITHDRAFT_107834 [Guillardia theta CCMP2712]|eukprot:XP_005833196.1 hypothetical protein GUITHDRAFT_107834 [Guillardia theta CCMP2712]
MSCHACDQISLEDAIASLYPQDLYYSPVTADPLDLMHSWIAENPIPHAHCDLSDANEADVARSRRWAEATLERSNSNTSLSSAATASLSDAEWGEAGNAEPEKKVKAKRSYKPKTSRTQWTKEEHASFVAAVEAHCPMETRSGANGKVFVGLGAGVAELIATAVPTRTVSQIRSHAQKYFLRESKKGDW